MSKNENFVVPGQNDEPSSGESYWFVQCTECKEIHSRIRTSYWQLEPKEDGGFTGRLIETDCIFCEPSGKHFRVDAYPPYRLMEIPKPVLKVYEPEADDESLRDTFE